MNDYASADAFAEKAHIGQVRKGYHHEPYIIHPRRAVEYIKKLGLKDEEMLQALVLHDTVEDTSVTLEEIKTNFGERVASIVNELTKKKGEAKGAYIQRFKTASADAVILKLADRRDNLLDAHTVSDDLPEEYAAKTLLLIGSIKRNPNVKQLTGEKAEILQRALHDVWWIVQQILFPELYDHKNWCDGGDDPADTCLECKHSLIVFHGGGPCFHVDEPHEYIALSKADLKYVELPPSEDGKKHGYLTSKEPKKFCACEGKA